MLEHASVRFGDSCGSVLHIHSEQRFENNARCHPLDFVGQFDFLAVLPLVQHALGMRDHDFAIALQRRSVKRFQHGGALRSWISPSVEKIDLSWPHPQQRATFALGVRAWRVPRVSPPKSAKFCM